MGDIALFGITGATLVALIVQAAKVCKLPSHYAPVASLVAGFIVSLGYAAHEYYPAQADPWIKVVALGLLLGLGASGIYGQTQTMQQYVQTRKARKAIAAAPEGSQTVVVPADSVPAVGAVVPEPDVPPSSNITAGV